MNREEIELSEHLTELRRIISEGSELPAGRLLGLPNLPDDDFWVDIAGAAALCNVRPSTITGWLSKSGPKRRPFPQPMRLHYRLYWPSSAIRRWLR